MAYKTLSARFPLRKLHRKEVFKKMQSAAAGARQAGGVPMPKHGSKNRAFPGGENNVP